MAEEFVTVCGGIKELPSLPETEFEKKKHKNKKATKETKKKATSKK
jgi:hypothetical protein